MSSTTIEPFVTVREVAAFLGRTPKWVRENAGELGMPRYKLGRQWRYRLSEVAEWVEEQDA